MIQTFVLIVSEHNQVILLT